jgi:hypothetical protein
MAQCFEHSLLPGVKDSDFEKAVFTDIFPNLQILRRNVRDTTHRLLNGDGADSGQKYIWLVFASFVGDTPQTAGDGADVLASDLNFVDEASELLGKYATLSIF